MFSRNDNEWVYEDDAAFQEAEARDFGMNVDDSDCWGPDDNNYDDDYVPSDEMDCQWDDSVQEYE